MTNIGNKTVIVFGSVVLLASVLIAILSGQPLLFFFPSLLLLLFMAVQQPVLLFYALLFFIPWSVEANVTDSIGTDLPDEPLMLLLAFAVIALWAYRGKQAFAFPISSPIPLLLLVGFLWSAITVLLSTHLSVSIKYLLAKGWYLLAFTGAPLVLITIDEKLLKRAAAILFGSMLLASLFAITKHAALGFTFASTNEALAPFFRNHVNYSALLVFMVPLGVAFYLLTINRRKRFAIILSLTLLLTALVLSYARGAWLALAVGLLAYWLIRKKWLLQSFLLAIVVSFAFLAWLQYNDQYLRFAPHHDTTIFHTNFSEHLAATVKGNDVSTAERFYRWVAGVRMSADRWATGFGPTTFYEQYQSYTVPAFRTWVSNNPEHSTVHNYFLLLLIEQGLPGLLFFLVLIGTLFWQAQKIFNRAEDKFWKITAASIAAILWMQCTVNFLSDLIETDKVGSVFYLCAAFLVIADAKTKRVNLRKEISEQ